MDATRKAATVERRRWPRLLAWVFAAGVLLCALAAAIVCLYRTTPTGDTHGGVTDDRPVDALLVLGAPAALDGSVSQVQRWRVDEAVRELRAGRAPRLVIAGGRTTGGFVESQVMGAYALRQGLPPGTVFEETRSRTTLENLDNTVPFLKQHGWTRIEVVSTPAHLHRAAVLLQGSGLRWRLHAAPTPGLGVADRRRMVLEEAVGTAALRVFGRRAEPLLHALATVLNLIGFGFRWIGLSLHRGLR